MKVPRVPDETEILCTRRTCTNVATLYPVLVLRLERRWKGDQPEVFMPLPRCPKCARSTRAPELVTDDLWERITKEVVGQAPAAPAGMPAPEAPRLARRRTLLRWVGFSSPQALDYKRRTTGTVLAKAPALTPTGIVSDPLLTRWRKMAVRRFGWPSFFYALPARLVYFCAMRVWGEATSGVYGTTVVGTLSMSDAIRRFARIHAIPGHGKDEHHDSNRGRAQL